MSDSINPNGIVLFAKQSGRTSFSSLNIIKHALHTKKVGHTGTLDSFASGLLVVCCGQFTRLAPYITELKKTYDAVIEFGSETDTLEWTGSIVKTAELPTKELVLEAVAAHTGTIVQIPPLFSALHIHGERASDIARSGRTVELPSRYITVYSATATEFLTRADDRVKAVRVMFSVSKGTYIRSLARDIGVYCKSAAHLAGLRRLSVGDFSLEYAAGVNLLAPFTIQSVYEELANIRERATHDDAAHVGSTDNILHGKPYAQCRARTFSNNDVEAQLQHDVCEKIQDMNDALAYACGFDVLFIHEKYKTDFLHGRPLFKNMFEQICAHGDDTMAEQHQRAAVFSNTGTFLGIVEQKENGTYAYAFVRSPIEK